MKRVLKANWIVSEGDQANGGKKSLVMKWTVESVPEEATLPERPAERSAALARDRATDHRERVPAAARARAATTSRNIDVTTSGESVHEAAADLPHGMAVL
jgi:hypothetical protein